MDVEGPDVFDDNPGGSGVGGAHMRFAGRLLCRTAEGTIATDQDRLEVESAQEVVLLLSASTDYNLSSPEF